MQGGYALFLAMQRKEITMVNTSVSVMVPPVVKSPRAANGAGAAAASLVQGVASGLSWLARPVHTLHWRAALRALWNAAVASGNARAARHLLQVAREREHSDPELAAQLRESARWALAQQRAT